MEARNTFFITGANRGIGLALARAAAAQGHRVIGTARNPDGADDLRSVAHSVEQLDAASDESCKALAATLADEPVDVLINNAGISPKGSGDFATFDPDAFADCLRTNAIGPLLVARALLPNLEAGNKKLIVQISSQMGSLGDAQRDANTGGLAYRSSKSALNMASLLVANELKPRGIACVMVHPGWVRTDMGGPEAHFGPEEAANAMLTTIDGLGPSSSGRFMRSDAEPIPW